MIEKRHNRPGQRPGLWPILALGVFCGGCDSDSFVPSRPAELTGPSVAASPTSNPTSPGASVTAPRPGSPAVGARAIELIVGPRGENESELLKGNARTQAGLDKVRLQISVVGEKQTPGSQAELVRKAINRNPLALIVEPVDPADPDLASAVSDARDRGILVLLVARPLGARKPDQAKSSGGGTSPGRAIIQVGPEPFMNSAHALVVAAVNNAKNAKLELEGGAILLIDTASDPLVEDRARALAAALKDAGIRVAHEITYASVTGDGEKKLGDILEADRKACIVLGADNSSTRTAYGVTNKKGSERPFVVAGYTADESEVNMTRMGEYAGIAVFSADRLIRKAITTAALAASGQTFEKPVEMKIPVITSSSQAGAPKMNEMMKSRMKSSGD